MHIFSLQTFEIWNPDETVISNRLPQMCKHIGELASDLSCELGARLHVRRSCVWVYVYDVDYNGMYEFH